MKYYYQIEGKLRNNIGDVLQGMVAKAFLPAKAFVVDRETLADIDNNEQSLLIANGWYMHSYDKFPPPSNVAPVYISVHIAQSALLLNKKVREHFKNYAPIGCRDKKTLNLFLSWGIPAYYSGCLTITTSSRQSVANNAAGEILLVDGVDHPIPEEVKNKLEILLGKSFTRVTHDPPAPEGDFLNYAERSEKHMENLLKRYCNAAMVVTTKIHCALPCLGMGANVMVVHPNPADPRLATVREFINITSYQEVLEAKKINVPTVKQKKLLQRKKFLENIVAISVAKGENILINPDSLQFKFLKLRSVLLAKVYKLALLIIYRIGISRQRLNQVYGFDHKVVTRLEKSIS